MNNEQGIRVTLSAEGKRLAYPKNTDVRDVRPALVDRLDLFCHRFPLELALCFAGCAFVVVIVASVVVH